MIRILFFILLLLSIQSHAGRTAPTIIKHIVVKSDYVEVWTQNTGGSCGNSAGWHLMNNHPNFDSLYSGFLASKASNKKVDIVGNGECNGKYEKISWAYVFM